MRRLAKNLLAGAGRIGFARPGHRRVETPEQSMRRAYARLVAAIEKVRDA